MTGPIVVPIAALTVRLINDEAALLLLTPRPLNDAIILRSVPQRHYIRVDDL